MKLSFVLPAYNVAPFLQKCLDSIYSQNIELEDYEVIVINDGSTDDTEKILELFASKYSNFRFYSIKNGGVGRARNFGMDRAKGDFIWFVDPDDIISKDVLSKIIGHLNASMDIVFVGYQIIKGNRSINKVSFERGVWDTADFLNSGNYHNTVWCKIFKRKFLSDNQLRFNENLVVSEDLDFSFKALMKADIVNTLNVLAYEYFIRNGSLMNRRDQETMNRLARQSLMTSRELLKALSTIDSKILRNAFEKWWDQFNYGLILSLYRYNYSGKVRNEVICGLSSIGAYPLRSTSGFKKWVIKKPWLIKPYFKLRGL
ncbi:glycosyltransferase [Robertkochia marina]|uniref:Glycosyltransferase n=1 Tax=Robertkochia marina TaxID=1227945 RepID=A0A4S3M1C5_9FLAO|nr:glycosyltransferase [Robertkochia marina]THD66773.1 glycosyltransferase [Robertkochia marina]TRZ41936.1 glycosyltransferase [Robertkochia marina]